MKVPIEIVIPVYNDFESLTELIKRIEWCRCEAISFLVVDNGSIDTRIWETLQRNGQNWSAVRTTTNLGFGGGILFGIQQSRNEWIGWMPGNLKIDPRDLENFISKIDFTRNILIKANRIHRTPSAKLKTLAAGMAQSLMLRESMFETGGTPTICRKEFVTSLDNPPLDYVFESYILYQARKHALEIVRPQIKYGPRLFGKSHWQSGLRSEVKLMLKIIRSASRW